MQDDAWLMFSERVSCEEYCHLDCVPWHQPVVAAQLQQLTERNLATLATLATLEERRVPTDDDNPVLQEIQRLDTKLSALVDLVNHLLVPDNALPPRQELRFNAVGAVLPAALVPDAPLVLLRLRLDVCRGQPLELPARRGRELDDGRAFLSFTMLNDVLGDAIERLVFRHHRRKVAETRQLCG